MINPKFQSVTYALESFLYFLTHLNAVGGTALNHDDAAKLIMSLADCSVDSEPRLTVEKIYGEWGIRTKEGIIVLLSSSLCRIPSRGLDVKSAAEAFSEMVHVAQAMLPEINDEYIVASIVHFC